MKKIKMVILMLLVFSICSFVSCGFIGRQKYICDINNVESIQIIKLDKIYVQGYNFTLLATVSDQEKFVDKLNNLSHRVHWGEPTVLELNVPVIRITYLNGDCDLICYNAQKFIVSQDYQTGYFIFDKAQFDELIADYLA